MNLIGAATSRVMGWFTGRELGQGMLEYALILGLIVVAIIAAFVFFNVDGLISNLFVEIESELFS